MYACGSCGHVCSSLNSYVYHCKFHRNIHNVTFACPLTSCSQKYCTYEALKCHISRHHNNKKQSSHNEKYRGINIPLICQLSTCKAHCNDFDSLLAHLRSHIQSGLEVTCPFQNCGKKFRKRSSFSAHISRCHKNCSVESIASEYVVDCEPIQVTEDQQLRLVLETDHSESDAEIVDSTNIENTADAGLNIKEQYLANLSLFYLKLQAKHLLPATTVQRIISEFHEVHDVGRNYFAHTLCSTLRNFSVDERQIKDIVDASVKDDLWKMCNDGPLRSDHTRKAFYKSNFGYISPFEICLGRGEGNSQKYCQYVPVIDTIQSLFKYPSVQKQHSATQEQPSENGILRDVFDGSVLKTNSLFSKKPDSIKIILYQDAFEVVNPLGSAKRKHKVLAVYMTLADILPEYRMNIDHMQLVLLCREVDFKMFGHMKVFSRLLSDLKQLETIGVTIGNGQIMQASVLCIVGDNLGSHCIGGFTENFSFSENFCRYCTIKRSDFVITPYAIGVPRTTDGYDNDALFAVEENRLVHGIKFASVFNSLQYFHVCCPGLPPCLGHDLFEGVVSYDVALFINYFVKEKKWFSYAELNRLVRDFKYLGNDGRNKPNDIHASDSKIGGHAVQNWCLLRLLPVIMACGPIDYDDAVWQLLLQLRVIVSIICAPAISLAQVAYLKVLIEEYIDTRIKLFPDVNVKPKHYYMVH